MAFQSSEEGSLARRRARAEPWRCKELSRCDMVTRPASVSGTRARPSAPRDERSLLAATAAGGRRRLAGGLGGELLARGLATGGLACGLLGASHWVFYT